MTAIGFRICLGFAVFSLLALEARAGDVADDWKSVTVLDVGPQDHPTTTEAAQTSVLNHLLRQETALRAFLVAHPEGDHTFEAWLRLSRVFQFRGEMQGSDKMRMESRRILAELEKIATPAQRTELDFANITQRMRAIQQMTQANREELYALARKFQRDHPDDRRVASLLAEVATLFDAQPKIKETLLEDAQTLAEDPDLRSRVADDLKRVRLIGETFPLHFTSAQGKEIDIESFRGRPLILVFFAEFSAPSTKAISQVQRALEELPKGAVEVVGVSLDKKPEELANVVKAYGLTWPVAFDGKGWESPAVRSLGINALPTVWVIDQKGRLRSLNGLDSLVAKVRQLLAERSP
jgi:peroxiredoxin